MRKAILGLILVFIVSISATAQMNLVGQYGQLIDSATYLSNYKLVISGKQPAMTGTGLPRFSGSTITYDNSVFLTANQSVTIGVTGSDITSTPTASGTTPSIALSLATVNSNVGSFGTASSVSTPTVNAKGLTTAIVNTAIQITESAVTSLTTDLSAKQANITFTTTGSGAATFSGNALNIPTPAASANFKFDEEYTGAATSTITLSNTPLTTTVRPFKNGVRLPAVKYSVSGAVVTLTDARVSSDVFAFDYNY